MLSGSHLSRLLQCPCCGYTFHLGGVQQGRVKDGTRCPHSGILQPRSVHFLLQSGLPPGWRQRCRTLIPCIARWPIPERSQNHRWCPKCRHVSLQHDRSRDCPLRLVWVPCGLKNNILVRFQDLPCCCAPLPSIVLPPSKPGPWPRARSQPRVLEKFSPK